MQDPRLTALMSLQGCGDGNPRSLVVVADGRASCGAHQARDVPDGSCSTLPPLARSDSCLDASATT